LDTPARGGDRLGATAVTLVPEMAKQAGHVTMLQRSLALCGVASGAGSARQQTAAQSAFKTRLSSDPLAQRAVGHVFLPAPGANAPSSN
jgi:cation diffusion facilitator CzcD-associated flavoprotein CzcO